MAFVLEKGGSNGSAFFAFAAEPISFCVVSTRLEILFAKLRVKRVVLLKASQTPCYVGPAIHIVPGGTWRISPKFRILIFCKIK